MLPSGPGQRVSISAVRVTSIYIPQGGGHYVYAKVQAHAERLNPEVHGDTVTLTDRYTTGFFEQWGVAGYMHFKTDVVVREGKIRSRFNCITLDWLLKIRCVCDSLQARGASDLWKACADFLTLARTQADSFLGPAARTEWCPHIAGLKPLTAETRFMSLPGYMRYLAHVLTDQWPKCVVRRQVSQSREPIGPQEAPRRRLFSDWGVAK